MDASKKKILDQLKLLGVNEGDVIFVTSDLMKVGYFRKDREETLLDWIDIFRFLISGSTLEYRSSRISERVFLILSFMRRSFTPLIFSISGVNSD